MPVDDWTLQLKEGERMASNFNEEREARNARSQGDGDYVPVPFQLHLPFPDNPPRPRYSKEEQREIDAAHDEALRKFMDEYARKEFEKYARTSFASLGQPQARVERDTPSEQASGPGISRSSGIREFSTGATRNDDTGKHDPEGFLSPLVIEGYDRYMHEHRVQPDGTLRDSDNWQKGIPISAYRKSLLRHVLTAWNLWRGWPVRDEQVGTKMVTPTLLGTLYAVLFNVMGYIHELEKERLGKAPQMSGMLRSRVIDDSAGREL